MHGKFQPIGNKLDTRTSYGASDGVRKVEQLCEPMPGPTDKADVHPGVPSGESKRSKFDPDALGNR